ncbi:hypothetical protein AVEN_47498-1 [Araneus ventricosus]|uniref:Uncharacterized protein n=1 Tax=Araneus ventricosus TaxID=182803 RepID=A0A4Y2S643_ARAVE|nr:hypothetical protein AVEN_47498-1 [Araneus ventricosus]
MKKKVFIHIGTSIKERIRKNLSDDLMDETTTPQDAISSNAPGTLANLRSRFAKLARCYFPQLLYTMELNLGKLFGFQRNQISYPNIPSAIRPVPHGPGIPIPSPPDTVDNIFYKDTESECETDDDVYEVYGSISDEPKLFTQYELNDLVRNFNLPKDSAEVLGSKLKKKMLAPGTSFSWFQRTRVDSVFSSSG